MPGYALARTCFVRGEVGSPGVTGSQSGLSLLGSVQSHAPLVAAQSRATGRLKMHAYWRSSGVPGTPLVVPGVYSWPLIGLGPGPGALDGGERGAPVIGFIPERGAVDSIISGSTGGTKLVGSPIT